jgi:hypothetical protein
VSLRPQHPTLHQLSAAIDTLRTLTPADAQDAALLILGIGGDGTGEPSLIGQLTTALVQIAQRGAAHLDPADADTAIYAARLAELTIDQIAGDQLVPALDLLEQHRPTSTTTSAAGPASADTPATSPAPAATLAGAR